jgi:hypothetical protein
MLFLKKRYPFNKPRKYQMDINNATLPSFPSSVQRETNIIPTNPVAPVDITRYITVGHKRHARDLQKSARRQRDTQVPQGTP